MKTKTVNLLMLLSLALVISCTEMKKPDSLKIRIIETSDVHGALFPWDLIDEKLTGHSLAQVYTFVEQERAKTGQITILLDNGDILQGDPTVYYSNFEKTSGDHIVSEVMNFMGYDAATVGNHDIEPGHPVYDKLKADFDFPWLAANALRKGTGQPYFEPYTVIEVEGIKIAILGLITPAIPNWLPPQIWEGMEFQDMIEAAQYWMDYIRKNEKPDVMIGLFHAGVDATYNNQTAGTYKNENASMLVAEQVPGFDVVFVGHDHRGWNKKIKNWAGQQVQILGPTSRARNVGVADLNLKLNKTTNHYQIKVEGSIINTDDFEPHPEFVQTFSPYHDEVKKYVAQPVGYLKRPIPTQAALFGDAAFTDLIHRAQLDISDAKLSFAAPLSFDKTIENGLIEVRDMFRIYRYENLLYTMKLGGQEIKDYLEYTASIWFNTMQHPGDHLLEFDENKARLKNPYYNFDSAEGMIYTVDVSKPDGQKVEIISLADGSPFDLNKTYRVAVNSYRGNGGGGHLTAGAKIRSELLIDRIIESTQKDLRYHLMEWISKQDTVVPQVNNNWYILPESWYRKAKKQDSILLFGTN